MRLNDRSLFSLILLAMFVVMFIGAWDYNARARLFPVVLSAIGVFMSAAQLLVDLWPGRLRFLRIVEHKGLLAGHKIEQSMGSAPRELNWPGTWLIFVWLAGFLVLLRYVGYLVAVPTFIALYIRFGGRQPWRQAVLVAGGTGLFMYLLFHLALKMRF